MSQIPFIINKISRENYDALITKRDNTLYIVLEENQLPRFYFGDQLVSGLAPSELENILSRIGVAESDIDHIEDGTTIVKKAEQDQDGQTIKTTYIKNIELEYVQAQNKINLIKVFGDNSKSLPISFTIPEASTVGDGLLTKEDKVKIDNIASDIAAMGETKVSTNTKNQSNGYAGLDANAKIPLALLQDTVLGQLEYVGVFNAAAGSFPTVTNALSPNNRAVRKGDYFIANSNGTVGGISFNIGDWLVRNSSDWSKIDNTDAVASVNGKLGPVVLDGTDIKVGSGDTTTLQAKVAGMTNDIANRYTKQQTLTTLEIEQRISDILAMANLQDVLIGSYTNGQTVLASDLSPYNFVIALGKDLDNTYTGTFKPSEIVSGNIISLSPTVYLTRGATSFTITVPTTVKLWGIKLDGIDASEIAYDGKTVEDALNEILVPAYVTATHEALQTEITATDAFEINDDTGDVVKITGNEPTNLVVNGDFSSGVLSPWIDGYNATIALVDGRLRVIKNCATNISIFRQPKDIEINTTDVYYFACNFESSSVLQYFRILAISGSTQRYIDSRYYYLPANTPAFISHIGVFDNTVSAVSFGFGFYTLGEVGTDYFVDNLVAYNVSEMKLKGVKNDDGVPFANLTNEEIKSQLDIWVQNGFPTVVDKLISKSDNLFNADFNTLSSLDSENLVSNGNFLHGSTDWTHSDNDEINQVTFANGKVTLYSSNATNYLGITQSNKLVVNNLYYLKFDIEKRTGNFISPSFTNPQVKVYEYEPSGTYSFVSRAIETYLRLQRWSSGIGVQDFDLDNIYCFNITDLVNRGILPSGLTNAEYKEMIDNVMFTNVPLRETNYIAVEPSKAYKLIKVSTNEVTHKVIEYTTDNQVVKVTPVVYTTNKFTFTTHALTAKVKLISDLMNRVPNLVSNNDLLIPKASPNENEPLGFDYYKATDISLSNGIAKFTATAKHGRIDYSITYPSNNIIYYFANFKASSPFVNLLGVRNDSVARSYHSGSNNFEFISNIQIVDGNRNSLEINDTRNSNFTPIEVDYMGAYNITQFKKAGVVNDSGTLFSRLTNDEIKDQMDIWVKAGFPDHVIAALYPNGVDSAIALKYNDADDIFRPQQIDELPLNLTLRSGEYWQDGYVVKQNGNAEYYPLDTKFSAWNYGQLEAVYTSGVPADFDIQYAQNTAGQVKTTQEFLVEAREQLDYVTEGYDNLVEKLGDAIFSDKYDSYAGITSDTYEYYNLEGIKEGNTLAIEGAGQSIQNLLGKGGTINATTTVRGVTVTYDSDTGVFTANGTATAGTAFNITLATGMDFGLPVGTPMQLMRYYDSGTIDLNGSYVGYTITGVSTSNRINENSEALYDPYINGSGNLNANDATNKQQVFLQVWAPGIVFTNFKFKIGIYEGLQLRPFILPSGEPAKSNVTVYNRTANMLNMPTALSIEDSGLTLTYDPYTQEFLLSGTATATKDVSLSATFNVLSGDRLSIKRLYQSGDVTAAGGTLPRLKLVNASNTTIVYNDIYKMTAPEGETPTPDVSFNTGTAPADATLTLKLGITSGQVFDNYRFRLMIHDKSTDIGYVAYRKDQLGNMSVGANERAVVEFKAIPYGILEFVADSESLNLLYADSITDLNKTYLEYNAGIISPNRKISELTARAELIDNPFRNKVIAVWGDSRESNNPTSDPQGVGDQKDTSWPALLAKKLSATVLNYGLSGGAWAENTVQQDAASAIVNRVQTEDISASADVIVISSMNDFKLASILGSPLPANKDKTTFYGAMRLTYDRLATKYPGKKIVLVLPQKRYDETVNYGGGSYYHYLKAQVEVAKEYGIPIVDLYHNFPNTKPSFYDTYMLNDTHFSAVGNDKVAELVARELIGNGNKGDMDLIPPIPTTDGTYKLQVVITGGIPVFSWVA